MVIITEEVLAVHFYNKTGSLPQLRWLGENKQAQINIENFRYHCCGWGQVVKTSGPIDWLAEGSIQTAIKSIENKNM